MAEKPDTTDTTEMDLEADDNTILPATNDFDVANIIAKAALSAVVTTMVAIGTELVVRKAIIKLEARKAAKDVKDDETKTD